MANQEPFIVEFSHTHRLFTVVPLSHVLALNTASYERQSPSDWLPLGVFSARDEAEFFRDSLDPGFKSLAAASIKSLEAVLDRLGYDQNSKASILELRVRQAIASKVQHSSAVTDWLRNSSVARPTAPPRPPA